ncbi:MAG TPA: uracil-DNA glycosylase family protein [Thermoplasmata archaeon]
MADGRALNLLAAKIRVCTLCQLHTDRLNAVPGEGAANAQIFLIGEAPGRREDELGRPFVGTAGSVLDTALKRAGLNRPKLFITNAVKCRPPANRAPRRDEVAMCRPYLIAQVQAVRPRVIVTLGGTALRDLLGQSPRIAVARHSALDFGGIPVIATYHPASSRYDRRIAATIARDLRRAARAALAEPQRIRSRPPVPGRATREATSAGAAVFGQGGKILLLRRADEEIWCLPKGTVEPGETYEVAAVREVREETGLDARVVGPLTEVRYRFYWPPVKANFDKRVFYFLARRVRGRLGLEPTFDRARWCTRSDALRFLHYENDKDVIRAAFAAWRKVTGRTPVRHRGASS